VEISAIKAHNREIKVQVFGRKFPRYEHKECPRKSDGWDRGEYKTTQCEIAIYNEE